jgi:hypothetical protein
MSKTRNLTRLFFVLALAVTGAGARRLFAQEEIRSGAACGEGYRKICYVEVLPDGQYEYHYWDG